MPPTPESPRPGRPDPAIVADRLAIADLMALYCRGIDRLDRDLVRSCFHPDATDRHGSFHGTIDEFLDWAFGLLGRYDATMHLIANHHATIIGDVAVAETYGIAFHRSADPEPRRNLTVGFRYVDRLERRDGETWSIARRTATTEWVRAPVPDEAWPIPSDSAVGRRDENDPLWVMLAELHRLDAPDRER
jgi:hypothetical protein